jgi:hypothetical protein
MDQTALRALHRQEDISPGAPLLESLTAIFGEPFLSYVLAQDELQLDQSLLPFEQRKALRELTALALQVQTQPVVARQIALVNTITAYVPESATTAANVWRQSCGGDLPSAERTDGVLASLLALALDTYPALLLPRPESDISGARTGISGPVLSHPTSAAFCRGVLTDPQLRTLFPSAMGLEPDKLTSADFLTISSALTLSLGRSAILQLSLLPDTLLASAHLRSFLSPAPLSATGYIGYVEEVFQELRSLAGGRRANIPVIYGLSNTEIPPDTALNVPWGILRSPRKRDAPLLPKEAPVGAVLETTAQVSVLEVQKVANQAAVGSPLSRLNKYRKEIDLWSQQVDRPCELMRLAILLASPPEGFLVAHQMSRTILDPLQSRPLLQWTATGLGAPGMSPAPIAAISAEGLFHVMHWAQKATDHPVKLDIAMRRTLSAVADRADVLDGFIDSILAWENLFSARPETTLRVCGAIAWLLEPDSFDRRKALYGELSKLYGNRSSLVHGSIATIDDAIAARDRAVSITLDCIRRLYDDRDLLLAKDSGVRGLRLLMGRGVRNQIHEAQDQE